MTEEYTLLDRGVIFRHSDNACIPPDPVNRDYQEYLKWLEEGNIPSPYVPPPPPPEPTPEEKLAASGLTVDELKQLLGLS